jgi:hypothetical protein
MNGNQTNGHYTIQRALDIVRNSEDYVDPSVHNYLERVLQQVWARIQQAPDTYVLNQDEFALFNYYRARFQGSEVARRAVQRFWDNYRVYAESGSSNGYGSSSCS